MAAKKASNSDAHDIINYDVSLPSFRDGINFTVRSFNYGGFKSVLRAQKVGTEEVITAMLFETLKRAFPNVEMSEVDNIELLDFIELLKIVNSANEGMNHMDFTTPTSTKN